MEIFPPGYRFIPTDQQLITCYLLRRAMGVPQPGNHILEKDDYGEKADPWVVFSDCHWDIPMSTGEEKELKKVIYVFTKLSKFNGKTRIARKAGCGTWDGQTRAREIYNESRQLIGSMKMFTFYQAEKGIRDERDDDDHWIMHEYSLAGIYLNCQLKHKDYVICRIKRSSNCQKKHPVPQISAGRVYYSSTNSCGDEMHENESDKKKLSQDVASCYKKQKAISSSTGIHQGESNQPESIYSTQVSNHDDNDMAPMLPDFSISSPGSIGFGELTEEDYEILNNDICIHYKMDD